MECSEAMNMPDEIEIEANVIIIIPKNLNNLRIV